LFIFAQAQIEREAEMYARGAELDLDLALHFHGLAKGSEDRDDAVAYQRAYSGCMRSMRQSLGFLGRLRKQERDHARGEAARAEAQPSPEARAEAEVHAAAVAAKAEVVRAATVARIRLEALDPLHEHELLDDLDPELAREAGQDRFLEIPEPVIVARLCAELGLDPPDDDAPNAPAAARALEPADSS
jgi:hypothetical protein